MMNTRCTKLSMVRDDSKSSKTSNNKCPVVLHGDHHYFMIVLFTITKSILNAVQLDFSFNLVCVKLLELNVLYKIFR